MQTRRHNITQTVIWIIQVFALVTLFALLSIGQQVGAQDSQPPSGTWSEVVNSDGSINYANLTDNGTVTQVQSWMPTVLGQPIPATYHVYTTPTGNQVLMPSATTLFFMASNPSESGYLSAASTLGTGGTNAGADAPTGIAGIGSVFGALLGNQGSDQMMSMISAAGNSGATSPESFFSALASGQTSIWSLLPNGLGNFLGSLASSSLNDLNLYTYMLLYTPGSCALSPAGCTAEQLALLLTPPPEAPTPPPPGATPPPPIQCPEPRVIPGAITFSGSKTAPNYPLVIGQDPTQRGVDLQFSASVAPTVYITYDLEPEYACVDSPGAPGGDGCGRDEEAQQVGWFCREVRQEFPECVASARGAASLSQESRNWILHELSNRYPGAHLKNPDFGFSSASACVWSASETNVQIADPGTWNLSVRGSTSGTPVSAPRSFGGNVDTFAVWLKETTIIK
jgi:hypothetical protein